MNFCPLHGSAARRVVLRQTALLPAVVLLLSSAAFAQSGRESFELRSGTVVDPESDLVFVMSPGGGTDALDLATGDLRWHSDQAGSPLTMVGGNLIAQVEGKEPGRLDIIILDAASGRLLQTASAALPEDVVATVVDGLGTSFRSWARLEGDELALGWESSRQVIRGTGAGPIRKASSGLRLDVGTWVLAPAPTTPTRPDSGPELREGQGLADVSGRHFLSADEGHFLASEPLQDRWGYRWSLFTRDGNLLGEVESPISYAPFFVADSLVVYPLPPEMHRKGEELVANPLKLRAVNLGSGVEVWSYEIRERPYRGPYPS